MRTFFVLLVLIAVTGCATNFEPKPLPPDHPASLQAREAPRSGMKRLIATDDLTRTTNAQLARKDAPNPNFQASGMSHDMGKMDDSQMKGMTPAAGATPPADKEAVEMEMKKTSDEMKKTSDELKAKSDEAKRTNQPAGKTTKSSPASTIYTCVTHREVQQSSPGKCPKCGMTLVKKESTAP